MQTSAYDYDLPTRLIAQTAIEPRDMSELLVASTGEIVPFRSLGSLLSPGDLVVVNRTKVRSARLGGQRTGTGGAIELLLVKRVDDVRWEAMLRPSKRLKAGSTVEVGPRRVELISDPVAGVATIVFDPDEAIEEFIAEQGAVPLPPYFTGELSDEARYQTMFAETVGSAAAPTAALHFTPDLVADLRAGGVEFASIDLEVGIDTFRPMTDGAVEDHQIHEERIVVDDAAAGAVTKARERGTRVVAVGTTVVRSLESAAAGNGEIEPYAGPTDLFITPGYTPKVVDAMITNFHAPRTTLLVLISALLGHRWRDLYAVAIDAEMRFLSFGDAMFIEVDR